MTSPSNPQPNNNLTITANQFLKSPTQQQPNNNYWLVNPTPNPKTKPTPLANKIDSLKIVTVTIRRWPTPTIPSSWPSDRQVVSLVSGQGYFTFLYGHTKHNIHKREGRRKENKQTRILVSSKRKKGEVCDTFLAFCELSRVYIRAKFPQSHQER